MASDLPLAGLHVLDMAGEMGAYGSRLLALAGADVIKVEPAAGDRQRQRPPIAPNAPYGEGSLEFAYYHMGKRSVVVDASTPEATQQLAALGGSADVIFISPSERTPVPGWDPVRRLLAWADSATIVCCLTAGGHGGPDDDLRATHLTSVASSGLIHSFGPEDGPPGAFPRICLYDELSAHAAAMALAALRERQMLGGQVVELSLHDLVAYRDSLAFAEFGRTRRVTMTRKEPPPQAPPSGCWETSDGEVELTVYNPSHWDGFFELAGRPRELADPALRDRATRGDRSAEILPIVEVLLRRMKTEDVMSRAQELRVPCTAVQTPRQAGRDRQFESRGFFTDYHHPAIGTFRGPGLPFLSAPSLLELPQRPAPRLGEHTLEVLDAPAAPTANGGQISQGERLSSLRVLSFGTAIAGNVSATTLAELGADVVKIESAGHPDPLRFGPRPLLPRVFEPSGVETTIMFSAYSRSCRSIALEMKNPADRETFLELAAKADVLIDNFATGVMASWGLSHQALAERNPHLVMVTHCGFGRTGPRSHYMSYGNTTSTFMGLPRGIQPDYFSVAHVLFAVFCGLANRDRTGRGAIVDIAQAEATAAMTSPVFLPALNGVGDVPDATAAPGSVLSAVLQCAGDDQWVAVELEDEADAEAAARVLGRTDAKEVDQLRASLAEWACMLTAKQAMRRLQEAGLAAAEVRDTAGEFEDAQLWARGAVVSMDHPVLGQVFYPAPFQRFSKTPVGVRRPSAQLGEHTDEVVREWLGERPAQAGEKTKP